MSYWCGSTCPVAATPTRPADPGDGGRDQETDDQPCESTNDGLGEPVDAYGGKAKGPQREADDRADQRRKSAGDAIERLRRLHPVAAGRELAEQIHRRGVDETRERSAVDHRGVRFAHDGALSQRRRNLRR
jgi:hypothetical protein